MRLFNPLAMLALATCMGIAGCKTHGDAARGSAAGSAAPATAPATGPTTSAAAPAAPAPSTAPVEPIASTEDYVTKASGVLQQVIGVFKADGTNCDKLADDLKKFSADNAALINATKAYAAAHPDAQTKYMDAVKDQLTTFETAASPAISACKDNLKLRAAMAQTAGN
jgi:hypothetical protein